jgi:hypothetical protein
VYLDSNEMLGGMLEPRAFGKSVAGSAEPWSPFVWLACRDSAVMAGCRFQTLARPGVGGQLTRVRRVLDGAQGADGTPAQGPVKT